MRVTRRQAEALLEALVEGERVKPFQVAKRRVMRRYGLLGSRFDRVATALLYRLSRVQGLVDRVIAERLGVDPAGLPPEARQGLRVAVLLALYDTVGDEEFNESLVRHLAGIIGGRRGWRYGRMVLKLYRGLQREPWAPRDRLEELEYRLLLPRIIVEALQRLLPESQVAAFAEAVNTSRPLLGFRVNRLKASVEEVLGELRAASVEAWPSRRVPWHIVYRGSLDYEGFRPLREGKVVPQDEASAAAAWLLGAEPGELVADLCAAPGGKTTHLAELAGNRASIIALELFPDRVERLVLLAERTGTILSIQPVVGDALRASSLLPRRRFHRVLLDPPCSSTGAIAKHPEARWRLTRETLARLVERQRRMLLEAVELLRPGGRLLYTVCSVMPEEGEENIAWLLEQRRDLEIVPLEGPYTESPLLPGTMRAWPHLHGTTGFYYALLERKP